MFISWALWMAALAVTGTSANRVEHFYGKNSVSKLHISKIVTEKNCGCNGTWDPAAFAEISAYFGSQLAGLIPNKTTTARKQMNADSLSVGGNTYTLALEHSKGYNRPHTSNATVWSKLISDMLLVANHTVDRSILIGEYTNTLGGTHNITLTVYGDMSCSNLFEPCEKPEYDTLVTRNGTEVVTGPGLDWSDEETFTKVLKIPKYNSSTLEETFRSNKPFPAFIYHEETGTIINTSTIHSIPHDNGNLDSRQYGCATPVGWTSVWNSGTWTAWGNWLPTSSCLYTGLDPSGGSLSFSVGMQMSYAESWGMGWSAVTAGLSGSFTFTITEVYSEQFQYTCQVPGYSVGQIWQQQLIAAGYINEQSCTLNCGITNCDGVLGPNYVGAPGDHITNLGCSTGAPNVACAAYANWEYYSVWSATPPH